MNRTDVFISLPDEVVDLDADNRTLFSTATLPPLPQGGAYFIEQAGGEKAYYAPDAKGNLAYIDRPPLPMAAPHLNPGPAPKPGLIERLVWRVDWRRFDWLATRVLAWFCCATVIYLAAVVLAAVVDATIEASR